MMSIISAQRWTLLSLLLACGCTPPASETSSEVEVPPAQSSAARPDPSPPTRVKAAAGVGKQGRSLDQETGIRRAVAQPARSLFAVRERTVFEIQIPQALQLFRATEGRLPKSHDEFMTRIIRANQIRLPELPEDQSYAYDAERGELMVETSGN